MIILGTINQSLEAVLTAAVTTTALPFTCHAVDILSSDQSVSSFVDTNGTITGTGAVTLMGAPASGHTRTIKSVTIYNADSTGAQTTVRLNDSATTRILVKPTLDVGDTLEYSASD